MKSPRAVEIIERMRSVRALIAGDAIIDHYVFGKCTRLCPEGPVPVFVPDVEESRPGGALNVKAQMDALCAPAWHWVTSKPTRKTRIMAGSHLLLRIDQDRTYAPAAEALKVLDERLDQAMRDDDLDVIVLSDYGKGWLTKDVCAKLIKAGQSLEIPVVVDPKGSDWSKYNWATAICPNVDEIAAWDGQAVDAKYILRKCGAEGLILQTDPNSPMGQQFPARETHVADVTGAGDTVVAVVAAVLGMGGSMEEACELANFAAGFVVGEIGTATCSREKLLDLVTEHHGRVLQ